MSDDNMIEVHMVGGQFVPKDPCVHGCMGKAIFYYDHDREQYCAANECINCGKKSDVRIIITGNLPAKVFCPECQAEGEKSKVFPRGSTRTNTAWQPFWDEDGNFKSNDPNVTTNYFECSRGHKWETEHL